MAKQAISRTDVYVYALFREDGITPFYVGMGVGDRWLDHERKAAKINSRKGDVILAMRAAGFRDIPKKKLAENLTREQAMAMEIELIALHGRIPNGPLTNHTKGGDRIVDLSDDAKQRQIASLKIAFATPEVRERMKQVTAERNANPAYRRKLSDRIKARFDAMDDETKAAIGQRMRSGLTEQHREENIRRMRDPVHRERINTSLRTPEVKAKRSAAQKAAFATPEAKLRRSEVSKKVWANGSHSDHGEKLKVIFSSEEFKARQTIALKESWTPERRAKVKATNQTPEVHQRRCLIQQGNWTIDRRIGLIEAVIAKGIGQSGVYSGIGLRKGRWNVRLAWMGKRITIGSFTSKELANEAFLKAAARAIEDMRTPSRVWIGPAQGSLPF